MAEIDKGLRAKLLEFQEKVEAITKNSTNPFFKSDYFDINALIEEVKPLLSECKILLLQPLSNIDGAPALTTILTDGKETIKNTTPLPQNPDPQKQGAIITYFRRYALTSLLVLQSEDNDAHGTGTKARKFTKEKPQDKPLKPQSNTPPPRQATKQSGEKSDDKGATEKQLFMLENIVNKAYYGNAALLSEEEGGELLDKKISLSRASKIIGNWIGDTKKGTPGERTKRIELLKNFGTWKKSETEEEQELDNQILSGCSVKKSTPKYEAKDLFSTEYPKLTLEQKKELLGTLTGEAKPPKQETEVPKTNTERRKLLDNLLTVCVSTSRNAENESKTFFGKKVEDLTNEEIQELAIRVNDIGE